MSPRVLSVVLLGMMSCVSLSAPLTSAREDGVDEQDNDDAADGGEPEAPVAALVAATPVDACEIDFVNVEALKPGHFFLLGDPIGAKRVWLSC